MHCFSVYIYLLHILLSQLLLNHRQVSKKKLHLEMRRLLESGAYFDLIEKLCGTYLRYNHYKRKCSKEEDAQYN